jgi:hypothetical protein
MSDLLSDRCEVLRVRRIDRNPAVIVPVAGPELVDINHLTATEIQL